MERGGSYIVEKEGKEPKRVEGTKPHPEGNAPRDADGKIIGAEPEVPEPPPASNAAKPPAAKPAKE